MLRLTLHLALLAAVTLAASAHSLAQEEPGKDARQARRAEGEQILRSLRDQARAAFAKTGAAPRTLTGEVGKRGCGADAEDLVGKHYTAQDKIYEAGKDKYALIAEPKEAADGLCLLKFNMAISDATATWHDTLEALKKDNTDITFDDAKPKEGQAKEGAGDDADDPWRTYRKDGRTWTYSLTGGMKMKTTIKNVTEKSCDMENQMVGADGKEMGPANTITIKFELVDRGEGRVPPPVESKQQKVKVTAGEFDCISYDDGKTWVMKKYPGIIVKSEFMELIEFKE